MSAAAKIPQFCRVRVWGMDVNEKPFVCQAIARSITERTAALDGDFKLKTRQIIGVQHGRKRAHFRVSWIGQEGTMFARLVGVECMDTENIFVDGAPHIGVNVIPPQQLTNETELTESVTRMNRRKYERYACAGGAAVRSAPSASPIYTQLIDISQGGCYLETLTPLPVGTSTQLCVSVANSNFVISVNGVVRTSDPMVGMGIQFTELTPETQDKLKHLIFMLHARSDVTIADETPNTAAIIHRTNANKLAASNVAETELLTKVNHAETELRELCKLARERALDSSRLWNLCEILDSTIQLLQDFRAEGSRETFLCPAAADSVYSRQMSAVL